MRLNFSNLAARITGILTTMMIFAAQAAQACPGCKPVVNGQEVVTPASMGFAYSIGFMFLMVMSVIGSLAWMMIKSARQHWRPADENAGSKFPGTSDS